MVRYMVAAAVLVMSNASFRGIDRVEELCAEASVILALTYSPPYSPGVDPNKALFAEPLEKVSDTVTYLLN